MERGPRDRFAQHERGPRSFFNKKKKKNIDTRERGTGGIRQETTVVRISANIIYIRARYYRDGGRCIIADQRLQTVQIHADVYRVGAAQVMTGR